MPRLTPGARALALAIVSGLAVGCTTPLGRGPGTFGNLSADHQARLNDPDEGKLFAWASPFHSVDVARKRSLATLSRRGDGTWFHPGVEDHHIRYVRESFQKGEDAFRRDDFRGAEKHFRLVANYAKDTPVAEDAIYYLAESQYRRDRLPHAVDTYKKLLKEHPNSRYLPEAVQRLYDVAYFWLEDSRLMSQGQAPKNSYLVRTINPFYLIDRRRPIIDAEGNALAAIKTITEAEPNGPLSDDARMMAGAHRFTAAVTDFDYVQAASWYEELVEQQPQSEFADKALILGAQARARAYRGPSYDGADLTVSKQLAKKAIVRGKIEAKDKLALEKQIEEIDAEQARRAFEKARTYEWMDRKNAARFCYARVSRDFPTSPWGEKARDALRRLGPPKPEEVNMIQRLADDFQWRYENWERSRKGLPPRKPPERVRPAPEIAMEEALAEPTAKRVAATGAEGPGRTPSLPNVRDLPAPPTMDDPPPVPPVDRSVRGASATEPTAKPESSEPPTARSRTRLGPPR
jgi:outer membrane protein assembly factor BamD (BamD/ComL family)